MYVDHVTRYTVDNSRKSCNILIVIAKILIGDKNIEVKMKPKPHRAELLM